MLLTVRWSRCNSASTNPSGVRWPNSRRPIGSATPSSVYGRIGDHRAFLSMAIGMPTTCINKVRARTSIICSISTIRRRWDLRILLISGRLKIGIPKNSWHYTNVPVRNISSPWPTITTTSTSGTASIIRGMLRWKVRTRIL